MWPRPSRAFPARLAKEGRSLGAAPGPASPSALQDACWRRTWPKQAPSTPGFHAQVSITYAEALEQVLARGGWLGLLGRGLGTRLLTNGIQASMFTVMWKLGEGYLAGKGM